MPARRPLSPLVAPAPLVAAAALLLALSGCSDDASPPAPRASATARPGLPADVRADLAALWAGDAPSDRDVEAGACFADALAQRTTLADLRAAGLVDEVGGEEAVVAAVPVLDEATARTWVAAQQDCVDFVAESTRAQVAATKGALDEPAYAACLRGALDDEAVAEALVATLTGRFDTPEVEALGRAQAGCATDAVPADQ